MNKKRFQAAGQELAELKRRIDLKEISKAELAFEMGYLTTATIDHWFRNKRIPHIAINRVRTFLNRSYELKRVSR